ncbi:MAG: hypothetical protein QOF84_7873 [Streptomyces sp.]|nr:hypothetical protein [Streptomyces sp.]
MMESGINEQQHHQYQYPNWQYAPGPDLQPEPEFEPEPEPVSPGYVVPEVPVSAWSVDTRRSTWISRGVLLCVLLVQAALSLRLQGRAFVDEALYIASGHYEIGRLLNGTPPPTDFSGYFSGHPMLYPVLAAAVDSVGGLAAVRLVSLVFTLSTTVMLYGLTSRLFNQRAGLAAAALFSVLESTVFLGNFATFDALALFLLACASWVIVRTGRSHPALVLLAVPAAALAPAVKYAAALYLPSLVVLAVLSAYPYRGARAVARGLLLGVGIALVLGSVAYLSGALGGIGFTTTGRAHGTDSALSVFRLSAEWGGVMLLVAVGGAIDYIRRARMGEMPWALGNTPGRVRRTALGLLMCGTALLAPAYQAHLHDDISLFKHVGFGLFFAAPMAGLGINRLMGAHFRYPQLGIMVWVAALVTGMAQTQSLYDPPDSARMVATMRQVIAKTGNGKYLAEEFEIPAYYLRDVTSWKQWQSTTDIDYTDKHGKRHSGTDGFKTAVREGHFDAIVLRGGVTPDADTAITTALRGNAKYRLLAVLPSTDDYGSTTYRIWVKR